jgi:hypothetical protein
VGLLLKEEAQVVLGRAFLAYAPDNVEALLALEFTRLPVTLLVELAPSA